MDDLTGIYPDFHSFFSAIDGNTPLNIASLAGQCTARASGTGNANRNLSEDEQEQMLALLEESLQQGACGVSLGLMYEPGLYAPKEELRKIAELCARYHRPLTVHPRANSAVSMAYPELLGRPHLLRALDELEEVTRGLNVKLQYSHAIFVGTSSFKCKNNNFFTFFVCLILVEWPLIHRTILVQIFGPTNLLQMLQHSLSILFLRYKHPSRYPIHHS